jgi:TRAP-type C4-dicarboxylate transport system permease small subunit
MIQQVSHPHPRGTQVTVCHGTPRPPARFKRKLAFLAKLAGCLICLYLGWEGLRMAQHAFVTGERALGIWQPLAWPKYATIPLGMFMTAAQYVSQLHQEWRVRRAPQLQETEAAA